MLDIYIPFAYIPNVAFLSLHKIGHQKYYAHCGYCVHEVVIFVVQNLEYGADGASFEAEVKHEQLVVGVFDTLSDSIQCLNFAKKLFIQYSIKYCFTQDSVQNIIQLKKKSADSI